MSWESTSNHTLVNLITLACYITASNRENSDSRSSETYSLPNVIYVKAWRTKTDESSCIHAFGLKKLVKYFKKSSVLRNLPEDQVTQEPQFANTHMSLWSGRDWNLQFRQGMLYRNTDKLHWSGTDWDQQWISESIWPGRQINLAISPLFQVYSKFPFHNTASIKTKNWGNQNP